MGRYLCKKGLLSIVQKGQVKEGGPDTLAALWFVHFNLLPGKKICFCWAALSETFANGTFLFLSNSASCTFCTHCAFFVSFVQFGFYEELQLSVVLIQLAHDSWCNFSCFLSWNNDHQKLMCWNIHTFSNEWFSLMVHFWLEPLFSR